MVRLPIMKKWMYDRIVPLKLKGKLYRVAIRPSMLYGLECWPITKALANSIEVAKLRMLRWTCGKTMLDMIPNEVYRAELEVENIINKMREGRNEWRARIRLEKWSCGRDGGMSLVYIGWLSVRRCGGKGGRGGFMSLISVIGSGWFPMRLIESNVGRGDGLVVLGGSRGGVVSCGGVVLRVVSNSVREKLCGTKGVVGGYSRGVDGGATL
ncbi:hypothetical protein Tco_0421910 [Tanacetum coccineum]